MSSKFSLAAGGVATSLSARMWNGEKNSAIHAKSATFPSMYMDSVYQSRTRRFNRRQTFGTELLHDADGEA